MLLSCSVSIRSSISSILSSPAKTLIVPPHLAALEDPRPDPSAHIPRHLIWPADKNGHLFVGAVTEEVVDDLLEVGTSAVAAAALSAAGRCRAAHVPQLDGRRIVGVVVIIVAHDVLREVEVDVVVVQE